MSDHDDEQDTRAILTRREMLIAAVLSGAAIGIGADVSAQPMPCLEPPRPWREVVFSSAPGRIQTPIERVPQVVREHLQRAFIYAAGGGLTSTPWRVMVGRGGALQVAQSDQLGAPSYALPGSGTVYPSEAQHRRMLELADHTWREPRTPPRHPTIDYGEVLAMRDGDVVYFADGYGPLRGGSAQALIAHLREMAQFDRR